MIIRNVFCALLIAVVIGAASRDAAATHKNWTLKNAGAQCFFTSYSSSSPPANDLTIANTTASARFAVCPVTLAARWGSSDTSLAFTQFAIPRWSATMSAKAVIDNQNTGGSVFDCIARARMSSGSMFFSQTASTTTTGQKALLLATSSNWGGTLDTQDSNWLMALDLDCRIPGMTTTSASSIRGYQVKICQRQSNCDDLAPPSHESTPPQGLAWVGDKAYIQTSGIECLPAATLSATAFQLNYSGAKNVSAGVYNVFCPLTQPADDSYWHDRIAESLRVYYKNDPGVMGDVSCHFAYYSHSSFLYQLNLGATDRFVDVAGGGYVAQPAVPGTINVGKDVSMGINCELRPGQTIRGVTGLMTLTTISGGI